MSSMNFLKRYFPNSPDWFLGGLLLVFIIWLIVLPIEVFDIVVKNQYYYPANGLGWIVRFLYIKGYVTSMSLIPLLRYTIKVDKLLGLVTVLLGLLISSPAYFATGALLTSKKNVTIVLGFLLVMINIVLSCYVAMAIAFSFD